MSFSGSATSEPHILNAARAPTFGAYSGALTRLPLFRRHSVRTYRKRLANGPTMFWLLVIVMTLFGS